MLIKDPLPTPAHKVLVQNFKSFLGNDKKFFYIDAPGGCGKTTVVKHIIKSVIPEWNQGASLLGIKPFTESYVTATHHKAASVLRQQGLNATTIHSHLGLVLKYHQGKFKLIQSMPPKGTPRQIVFIDECSYTCDVVYWYTKQLPEAKIVLVGDRFQAPPVGAKESVIYQGNPELNVLTEILRTDIPKLKTLYQELRQQLEFNEPSWVPLIEGVVTKLPRDHVIHVAANNPSIILGYKNTTVVSYNESYRDFVELPRELVVGDSCMLNSAIETNGGSFIPTDSSLSIRHISHKSTMKFSCNTSLEVIQVAAVVNNEGTISFLVADTIERKEVLAVLKKNKQWTDFYTITNSIADVRFTHSLTVHKSQGSTYENVIIDLDDLSKCTDTLLARKLLYVAITRAKGRVYLVGELAERIGTISDAYH